MFHSLALNGVGFAFAFAIITVVADPDVAAANMICSDLFIAPATIVARGNPNSKDPYRVIGAQRGDSAYLIQLHRNAMLKKYFSVDGSSAQLVRAQQRINDAFAALRGGEGSRAWQEWTRLNPQATRDSARTTSTEPPRASQPAEPDVSDFLRTRFWPLERGRAETERDMGREAAAAGRNVTNESPFLYTMAAVEHIRWLTGNRHLMYERKQSEEIGSYIAAILPEFLRRPVRNQTLFEYGDLLLEWGYLNSLPNKRSRAEHLTLLEHRLLQTMDLTDRSSIGSVATYLFWWGERAQVQYAARVDAMKAAAEKIARANPALNSAEIMFDIVTSAARRQTHSLRAESTDWREYNRAKEELTVALEALWTYETQPTNAQFNEILNERIVIGGRRVLRIDGEAKNLIAAARKQNSRGILGGWFRR